jgi:hypothetical protein
MILKHDLREADGAYPCVPKPIYRCAADVCIEAHDSAEMERLLRYCARPPFAMERLCKEGDALVYRCDKQYSEPPASGVVVELTLTPLELIDRIAVFAPYKPNKINGL